MHNLGKEVAQLIVDNLNELLKVDPEAIEALLKHRVLCNDAVLEHPTLQARHDNTLSVLGFFNGIVGTNESGLGLIAMVVDDDKKILNFTLMNPKK